MSNEKQTIEEKYKHKENREHILDEPDMYMGNIESDIVKMWIYDDKKNMIVLKDITYSAGLLKIFDEILVNARDHSIKCPSCKKIKIDIDKKTGEISVENDGDGIDVAIHKGTKLYVPQMIFAQTYSSGNYDQKNKITGGKNGIGAKITNIFSKEFKVTTLDAKTHKKFFQKCEKNMSIINTPKIKSVDKKEKPFTKISFIPDYKRFDFNDGLTDDMFGLFKKRVYDIALSSSNTKLLNRGMEIYFNGELVNIKSFPDYIKLFFENEEKINEVYEQINDRWRLAVIYNNDNGFNHMSFVNSVWTYKGGTHINYIVDQIVKKIIEIIKQKEKDLVVQPSQVKENLTIFLDTIIDDPKFDSQTKENLTSKVANFGSTCVIGDTFIKRLEKTGLIKDIIELAKVKYNAKLSKSDGKKNGSLHDIIKLEDAHWAGTKRSDKTRLILVEGLSAKSFAVSGLKILGREKYGIFPLKGKVLNVREASVKQISENQEFINIKRILGLKQGKIYNDVSELRYGGILILTDQDVDGSHIKGLIINMIHYYWPSLLNIKDFVQEMVTPLLIIQKKTDKKGTNKIVFYSEGEFNKWLDANFKNDINEFKKKYSHKYFKGLGTHTNAIDVFSNPVVLNFKWEKGENVDEETDKESNKESDKETNKEYGNKSIKKENNKNKLDVTSKSHKAITLAFAKNQIENRKKWLKNYNANDFLMYDNLKIKEITYSDFINKELIHFSNYDNIRSIPRIDGLKPSQRKILYTAMKYVEKNKEIKVAQLASKVGEKTQYKHGETSLAQAIVGMAQNFVGANNIYLLKPDGQFGTRMHGGKDAASSRYIFTRVSDIAKKIYREDDLSILEYEEEEGEIIEPKMFCPIIPTILINGTEGIGTGFSTNIVCFNPKDVIDNIKNLIKSKDVKPMIPWFRNFTGKIKSVKKNKFNRFVSIGKYEIINESTIKVIELPIGVWTDNYKEILFSMIYDSKVDNKKKKKKDEKTKNNNNKILTKVINNCFDEKVDFTISFKGNVLQQILKKGNNELLKKLKLIKSMSLDNMHLYNADIRLTKYNDVSDILKDFYDFRYKMYIKRKEYILKFLKNGMLLSYYKMRFIHYKLKDKIKMENKKEEYVIEKLKELDFPKLSTNVFASEDEKSYKYITSLSIFSLTKEKKEQLENEYNENKKKYDSYKKMTIEELWIKELNELEEEYDKWLLKLKKESESNEKIIKNKRQKNKK